MKTVRLRKSTRKNTVTLYLEYVKGYKNGRPTTVKLNTGLSLIRFPEEEQDVDHNNKALYAAEILLSKKKLELKSQQEELAIKQLDSLNENFIDFVGENKNYKRIVPFLTKCFGRILLFKNLSTHAALRFSEFIKEQAVNQRNGNELSEGTKFKYFSDFLDICKKAQRADKMEQLPKVKLKELFSEPKVRQFVYFDKEEILRIESTPFEDDILKRAFLFSCYSGLRVGDLETIKWKNISIVDDDIYLDKVLTKGAKHHNMILSKRAYKQCVMGSGESQLFPGFKRNYAKLRNLIAKAGIDKYVKWHTCRHSFSVNYLRAGGGIYQLSRMLAHESISITEKYYLRFVPDMQREAAARIDSYYGPTPRQKVVTLNN